MEYEQKYDTTVCETCPYVYFTHILSQKRHKIHF